MRLRGTIDTIAGTGEQGTSGDGGPATEAKLAFPEDVAVDDAGNVYITDGARIRKVDADEGTIRTIAGMEEHGYSGDGGPAAEALLSGPDGVAVDDAGNVYIADSARIRKVDAASGGHRYHRGNWRRPGSGGYRQRWGRRSGHGGPAVIP